MRLRHPRTAISAPAPKQCATTGPPAGCPVRTGARVKPSRSDIPTPACTNRVDAGGHSPRRRALAYRRVLAVGRAPRRGSRRKRGTNAAGALGLAQCSWTRFPRGGAPVRCRRPSCRKVALGRQDACVPPRRASAGRGLDRLDRETASHEQPRNDRVGVPHLAGTALVSAPDECGNIGHRVPQSLSDAWIVGQPVRAFHGLGDVGDDAVVPPPNLVSEDPRAPGPARTYWPFDNDSPLVAARVWDGSLFDHKASRGREVHLKRRVAEVGRRPVLQPCRHRLERSAVRSEQWPPAPNGNQYRSTAARPAAAFILRRRRRLSGEPPSPPAAGCR